MMADEGVSNIGMDDMHEPAVCRMAQADAIKWHKFTIGDETD
jgi:hypothetical protein